MFESRTAIANEVLNFLKEHFSDDLLATMIPKNVAISEAAFKGRPVVLYKAISPGSQAYLSLSNELLLNNEHQISLFPEMIFNN